MNVLIGAIYSNNLDDVKNAFINFQFDISDSANILTHAVLNGNIKIIKYIIKQGMKPNKCYNNESKFNTFTIFYEKYIKNNINCYDANFNLINEIFNLIISCDATIDEWIYVKLKVIRKLYLIRK